MLEMAELMKKGGTVPDNTCWNSSRVGTTRIGGGELAAWGPLLKPSSHIHRTGKKKTNTTNQPITVQRTFEVGNWRGATTLALCASAGTFGLTELIAWAQPERWRRACAAQQSRR